MARQSWAPPVIGSDWRAWAHSLVQTLRPLVDRSLKVDEDIEPPHAAGAGSRIVLSDTNGVRYAITVSTAGALVVTSL